MNKTNGKRVFVAMSGGVDSSVAALLLKNHGYNVTGVFMKNWADPAWPCPWQQDREDAMRVCLKLGVPFETFDFTNEYKTKVVDYMVREYAAGRTPNPDVMCNKEIKFGLFLDRAIKSGADFIATGHYVRKSIENLDIENSLEIENCKLKIAKDKNKDQSYFLWTLMQAQIAKCLFPIGEIESKAEVRRIALASGLPTAGKKDSQGICFMGPVDMGEFIKPYVNNVSGDIVTASGQKIGRHAGLDFYTIGQRKGVGVGGTGPYYVAKKDYKTSTLVVAPKGEASALESKSVIVCQTSFIGDEPSEKVEIQAAIRYRQEPVPAKLERLADSRWQVVFERPVRAVAPGQSAVFYSGEELLGGGIIE
ncbi:MAG: tRNA 2-thiouridine(34) synthase MnmA [Parcubacteria group bacterium]|nr:tRNA 2-thiouridine(34) synthase MnmA [Parcubacteria group bacterium]